jgi:hypothetical protein
MVSPSQQVIKHSDDTVRPSSSATMPAALDGQRSTREPAAGADAVTAPFAVGPSGLGDSADGRRGARAANPDTQVPNRRLPLSKPIVPPRSGWPQPRDTFGAGLQFGIWPGAINQSSNLKATIDSHALPGSLSSGRAGDINRRGERQVEPDVGPHRWKGRLGEAQQARADLFHVQLVGHGARRYPNKPRPDPWPSPSSFHVKLALIEQSAPPNPLHISSLGA